MKSHIAVFDIETGKSETVFVHDGHIEAPNWTRDGKALLVNGGGRLYRVALAAPALDVIDTGFAVKLNNDHGISPDGTMLALSDSTEEGKSAIYTVAAAGGAPRRITEKTPSYWHGWSPDGRTLAYTAKRGPAFEIYTCPVDGGAEFQVTDGFDHCDGPDYTPDGQWIWFNGEKDGAIDLYRVHPDGGGLERMTDDERVNWFPHPAPDGKTILYLAYEHGTTGHPANRNVELRLMPAEGGAPEILTGLLGGQGTINVPCWAPGSRHFAYVFFSDVE